MLLRRVILTLMLFGLGACAVAGVFAVFVRHGDDAIAIIVAAIAVVVAMGILLPLTFLVDRPRYRHGGIALMLVVAMALLCVLMICGTAALPYPINRTIEGIFFPSLGFVLLFGLPAGGALLLDQFPWAKIAARFLAACAALCLPMGIISNAIWEMEPPRAEEIGNSLTAGTLCTYGLGFLAALLLVNARTGDRRYFRIPALLLDVAAFIVLTLIVAKRFRSIDFEARAICCMLALVIFCAHLNLLLMLKQRPAFAWLKWATVAASALCAIVAIAVVVSDSDKIVGPMFTLGIAGLCGSLALIVLTLFSRRFDYRADATPSGLLKEVQLTCPRCSKAQTLPLGDSACCQCGLRFSINATEPQCLQCGYLLYGLSTPRCPECGAPVLPTGTSPLPA
jgi:hypothetical protein